MKRFLVSISGRSNLGSKGCKLRDYEICCAYVHGKSKAEAISKFWEQLEKNPLISRYYTRRDFKIEAERWESDELNCNGEPLGDLEWALPFDQLACAVWNNKTNKLESAEIINKNLKAEMLNEMAQAELEEMKSCMIKSLDEMQEDLNRAEASEEADQAEAEAIQNGKIINPKKKYHVISWKIGAPVEEKTDCGIWDGSGMAHFSEGFGGFTYSADGWLYFAQEIEDEITAEPDQETAQESNSEAQDASFENRWRVSVFFSKDQIMDELISLRTDLQAWGKKGCTNRHEHQMNRYIRALEIAIDQLNMADEPVSSENRIEYDDRKEA